MNTLLSALTATCLLCGTHSCKGADVDPPIGRLSDYQQSSQYYTELHRPQFHFTPPMNWMNDPNGMVYFDGEYHLFYQHNPHGNTWGHMSWGHAVSTDLVHWEHLPIALQDHYGVMIFSGSAVVDWENTSGFGHGDKPPMVAIYTGHGHGKQTQDIAYSNDRGRTWIKYDGNPVIDLNMADFRDPKVFWHEATRKWVMTVSMPKERKVHFYGSPNLKEWELLSEFGPAGAVKGIWECPDLFPLKIEGTDASKWVLIVNIGSESVAGGSGCQYFVGDFDGRQFVVDSNQPPSNDSGEPANWVDHGKDFYAAVSWSDVPKEDGRRLWLGWLSNWQYANNIPTHPWRSAMSIPRSLALRTTTDGLRMVQSPVKELRTLREEKTELINLTIENGTLALGSKGISGKRLEIIADVKINNASEIGFRLRTGNEEASIVGYDVKLQELFVDRTSSGNITFHDSFTGKHTGPLTSANGRIRLHIYLDDSSIEIFGNRGETVLSERIFPSPENIGVEFYSKGGNAKINSLRAWKLKSIWN